MARLAAIRSKVPPSVGLVLHGASGLPADMIKECTAAGVVKYNVNTEVRSAYVAALSNGSGDLVQLQLDGKNAMFDVVQGKIELFGSKQSTLN